MKPIPLIRRDLVVARLETESVAEALSVLARMLAENGAVTDYDTIRQSLAEHAALATVRIDPQIALAHYRTDTVGSVVVCLGIAPAPLDTGDPAWTPGPRVLALVLAPTDSTTAYLQTVSALAGALRDPAVLDRLLDAGTPDDVLDIPALAGIEVKPRLTVRDVMTPVTGTVSPELSVRRAVERMMETGTTSLVVVGEKDEVLGIVSESDVMRGLGLDRTRPAGGSVLPPLRVRDVMSRSVMCTADRASLDEVANIMINKDVDEVPVVAEGRLTGIVRRGDILRTLYGR